MSTLSSENERAHFSKCACSFWSTFALFQQQTNCLSATNQLSRCSKTTVALRQTNCNSTSEQLSRCNRLTTILQQANYHSQPKKHTSNDSSTLEPPPSWHEAARQKASFEPEHAKKHQFLFVKTAQKTPHTDTFLTYLHKKAKSA